MSITWERRARIAREAFLVLGLAWALTAGLSIPYCSAFIIYPLRRGTVVVLEPPSSYTTTIITSGVVTKTWRPLYLSPPPRGGMSAPTVHDDVMSVLANPESSLKEVMEVVGQHVQVLDAECLGRAFNRLSSFPNSREGRDRQRASSSADIIVRDSRFQSLVGRILEVHEGWDGKSLSLTLNGLARLQYHPGVEVLGRLRLYSSPLLAKFQSQSLSLLLHGFIKLGYDPGEEFMQSWRVSVLDHIDSFKPQELATMVNALAKLPSYHPEPSFLQSLEAASRSKMVDFWPRDYANLVSGLAALGHRPNSQLVRDMAMHLPHCISRFKAQEVANVVHGVGKMGCEPLPALLDPLLARAVDQFQFFKAEELAGLMHGLGKLAYDPTRPHFWEAFFTALPQRLPDLKGQELANILYGLAKLRRPLDARTAGGLLSRLSECLDHARPLELISILHSLGRLKLYPPPELLTRMVDLLYPQLASLAAWDLATLLTSFGLLKFYPGDRFMVRMEAELPRVLSSCKTRDMAEVMAGLGSINYSPSTLNECLGLILPRLEEFKEEELLKLLIGLTQLQCTDVIPDLEGVLAHRLDHFRVFEVGKILSLLGQCDYQPQPDFVHSAFKRVRHLIDTQGPLPLEKNGLAEFAVGLGRSRGNLEISTSDLAWLEDRTERALAISDIASIHTVVTGLIKMGNYQPTSAFLEAVAGRVQAFLYAEGGMSPIPVVGLLNSFNTLNFSFSPSLWATFVEWATCYLEDWTPLNRPYDIAILSNAMARAGQAGGDRWWAAVEKAAATSLEQFDAPSLVLLMSSLAQLDHTPNRKLLTALVKQALANLEDFTARGLASFLESLASLRYYPGKRIMASFLDSFTSRLQVMDYIEAEELGRSLIGVPEMVLAYRHYPGDAFLMAVEARVGENLLQQGRYLGRTVGMLASFERKLDEFAMQALVQGLESKAPGHLAIAEAALLSWGLAAMEIPGDHPVWVVPLDAIRHGLEKEMEAVSPNVLRRLSQVDRYFNTCCTRVPVGLEDLSRLVRAALERNPPLCPPQPKLQAIKEVQEVCGSLEGWKMELGEGWEDVHAHGILTEESKGHAYAIMVTGAHDYFHRNNPTRFVGEASFVTKLLKASGAFEKIVTINLDSWVGLDEQGRRDMVRQTLKATKEP